MKKIKDWLTATGIRNFTLLVVAIAAFVFGITFIFWMALGAFIWDNGRIIYNLIRGIK